MRLSTTGRAVLALLVMAVALFGASGSMAHGGKGGHGNRLAIDVLSNRADLLSGGNALVEVKLSKHANPSRARVELNGTDVTSAFAVRSDGRFVGLVTGLTLGENTLTARESHGRKARITLTNHPIGGSVFSGPQLVPYFCRTELFGLTPAVDAQCNAPTVVSYRYRTLTGAFAVYNPASPPPADQIANTTTDQGVTVPYIVRVERGTINRGIYELAVLVDPAKPWTPWSPQAGWNHKVYWLFGGGTAPWRTQAGPSSALVDMALSRGFLVANSSLNIRGQNANDWVSGESVMMLQEQIRESFGSIRYTIGSGCSGGSIQQHLIAANYPGLLDGILPNCSYEDSWTTAMEVNDCHLLLNYFAKSPALWASAAQRAAVSGHKDTSACIAWELSFAPVGNPARAVNCNLHTSPDLAALVYNPVTNPGGIRCTVQDHQVAIWGRTARGFARRPTDDVGVQFGLEALQAGRISVEQFVDLNEKIGGVDTDFNFTAERTEADPGSMSIAYWAGQVSNPYALASVPMIDLRGSSNTNDIHTDYHSWAMRARLDEANGGHGNQLIWSWPSGIVVPAAINVKAFLLMDRWLTAIENDHSSRPQRVKVLRDKPGDAVDLCYASTTPPLVEITDPAACAALLPYYADARLVAGMPLSHDILKCRLEPLRRSDYSVTFTDEQWARLESAFPTGVCDWSKQGVGQWIQRFAQPWLTFEDGPGGRPLGSPPRSRSH
ncbi:MAG TPA: DUF6351 family protein [Gaiellaceae bacterium]|nr:DUF6351 family protein [Gaiellaceae bacterium]